MRAAVFSVTRRGAELSKRIAKAFPDGWDVTRFCFERYPTDGAEPFANLEQKTAEVFPECSAVVFVCACGIAVRAVETDRPGGRGARRLREIRGVAALRPPRRCKQDDRNNS